ncbi:hypothetical protein DPMN_089658 [Dreissena polymorpha]|uniref:DDE-1 domain-containing protein n=1 Tax=Dreissena polymorpha TaxID=45954 RepID=A0A9D4KX98_DREPO|nr:hypothetical protein DPMN_089658 [Dreissena polymorpha]
MMKWAREGKLYLICLPVYTSHVLQPLDVGVVGPLKRFYDSKYASTVPPEKPMPCGSFRDSTYLQKIQAVRAGRQAVEESPGKNRGANPITACRCQRKISEKTNQNLAKN